MGETDEKCFSMHEFFSFIYSDEEMIVAFRQKIGLSNVQHEDDVILELDFEGEKANMAISGGSLTLLFLLGHPRHLRLGGFSSLSRRLKPNF